MRVIDVLTSPWAIMPEKLVEISGIYSTHLKGDKIDIKGLEARIGRPLENRDQGYEVVDGVAIIPVYGVIAKKMNLFQAISGGVSTEMLARDIREALADGSVKSIILEIDSPGGAVDGTEDIAKVIYESRGSKPIVTLGTGVMASAAYWIGAAADKMYIGNKTTAVGSIGVVATHGDYSEANSRDGVKITEITAGKYKRIPSENEALTDEGRAVIQDRVDYIYSVFVDDVAKFKGVSVETVLKDMADGRVFLGQQAIDAGLVEGISTLEGLIEMLSNDSLNITDNVTAGKSEAIITTEDISVSETENEEENVDINKDYILKNHPEIAESLKTEGQASVDTGAAKAESANAERQRIQDVMAQSMPGHEDLIQTLAFDGKTTGPEAAVQILQAEKAVRGNQSASIKSDAAEIPKIEPVFFEQKPEVSAHSHLPLKERCDAEWKESPDLRAEYGNDPEAYFYFQEANAAGLVKIQGAK